MPTCRRLRTTELLASPSSLHSFLLTWENLTEQTVYGCPQLKATEGWLRGGMSGVVQLSLSSYG